MRAAPGEDEQALATAARTFARSLEPDIDAAERDGRIPLAIRRGLADLGVLGMTAPESSGGLGASTVAFAVVLEELAAVWPSLAVAVSVSAGIVTSSLVRYGSDAQRAEWLPRLRDGGGLGAFALTEPDAGSDAAALRARATPHADGWRLRGRKMFVTNAGIASLVIVFARTGDPEPGRPHAGISAFLVPMPSSGLHLDRAERKMGLHASDTSPLTLEDVALGAGALLGPPGGGFRVAMAGLDAGRIGIAAQAVGIARGALDRATSYVRERRQFGSPLAAFGAVRTMLAHAWTDVDAARLLMLRAAWLRDQGRPHTVEAAMAKLAASEAAGRATHVAVQLLGGYGYVRDMGVERFARDARATSLYEGTSEIQRTVIARALAR